MNFSRWAKPYQWLTDHALWRTGMLEIAKQLPPSAAHLRLLDVSCGTGTSLRDLLVLRPDIRPFASDLAWGMLKRGQDLNPNLLFLNGDAYHLPFADNSMDAILMQRTYYFLPQKSELLAESLRVLRPGGRLIMVNPSDKYAPHQAWREMRHPKAALDMWAWHTIAHRINRRYSPKRIAQEMETAGFARILAEPILNGWAMMSRGEKPHAQAASTLERVALAASDASGNILRGDQLKEIRGRFIHLLIRQTPNKPVWKLAPDEQLHWEAVGIEQGEYIALGFSALPKAVSFMQAAVLAGWVQDVNKVAKFNLETASTWDFPVWLNPEFNADLTPQLNSIDPHSAEAPDE